jgi:3-carboxy-cis,cis-muconate cycloisomerase
MVDAGPSEPGLFDGVLARGDVRSAVGDRAWLQAMLDFEAALARAEARAGLFAAEDAAAIARACRAEDFDVAELGRAAADAANPAVPLARALTAKVGGTAAEQVHRGATSQDVIDTAGMLIAKRALGPLLSDLTAAADAAARLASTHRETLMAGRTLLQQALPITFGLKAAGWLSGLDDAAARLEEVRRARLAVQLGGAAGTLASLGNHGPVVAAYLAEELGLVCPAVPWHTTRTRIAELAGALGEAAGALGKPARDVTLLAQTEIAEVREGGAHRGDSSTLPQKRNPVAAVSAMACALRAPGLVATLLSSMVQEHERAAGAWHAEWRPLTDLLVAVGSGAAWLRDCLEHLEVDGQRMRENLDRAGGALLSERVTASLSPAVGRLVARDLVESACAETSAKGRPFGDVLRTSVAVREHLDDAEIATLLDPSTYLGCAQTFVDRALEVHAARRPDDVAPRETPAIVRRSGGQPSEEER